MHPGVTTALSLTLVAASLVGWQGPARGMRAWVRQAHPTQARQALIRESLGLLKSVPTQVPN